MEKKQHGGTEETIANKVSTSNTAVGVFSADLEANSIVNEFDATTHYYIPKGVGFDCYPSPSTTVGFATEFASYDKSINPKYMEVYNGDIYKYVDSLSYNIKRIYYTTLARERYGTYKGDRFTKPLSQVDDGTT